MNRILFFLGFVILFGCKSKPKEVYPIPNEKDINEIVKATIKYDSVITSNRALSIDLHKIKIFNPNPIDGVYIPPPVSDLNVNQLTDTRYLHQTYFSKKDSLYLLFQNDILKQFRLDSNVVVKYKLTSKAIQEQNKKTDKYEPYLQISIPIFTLDQKHAYIQFDYLCAGCGGGTVFFLEKSNGHWKIVKFITTWRS
jgi:hypothetical protein